MSTKRKQLDGYNPDYAKCRARTWGHAWEDIPSPSRRHNWGVQPDILVRCTRCTTEKFLWLDHEGNIDGAPQMDYPDDYKLQGLYRGDRLTAAELRAWVVSERRKEKRRRLRAV